MRRSWLIALGLIATGALLGSAQNHRGGYAVGSVGGRIFIVDDNGTANGTRVVPQLVYGLTMDVDNQLLVCCSYPNALVRIDPRTMTVVGTVYAGSALTSVRDVVIDHHGDYYVTDAGANSVVRITPSGVVTTVFRDPVRLRNLAGGLVLDVDTGELIALDTAGDDTLWRIARDGSGSVALGNGFDGRYGCDQHIPSAEIYTGAGGGAGGSLQRLRPTQSRATSVVRYAAGPTEIQALKVDRASAVNQQLVATGAGISGGIWHIDYITHVATSVTLFYVNGYEVEFLRGRNVQTVRTGRGRWDLQLSFPGEIGVAYLVLVSGSGPRPALLMPDGRALNLATDPLFFMSLQGRLTPFLTAGVGALNRIGEARAALDLRALGAAANGIRLWFLALTIDPSAPAGLGTIADPVPFVVEGL